MTINPHHSRPTSYSMQQQSIHDLSITSTDWSLPLRRCCNKRWWWRETRSRWNGNTLAKPVNNNIFRRTLHPAALNIKQLTDLTTWAHVDPRMALCDKNAVFPRLLRSPRVVVFVVLQHLLIPPASLPSELSSSTEFFLLLRGFINPLTQFYQSQSGVATFVSSLYKATGREVMNQMSSRFQSHFL